MTADPVTVDALAPDAALQPRPPSGFERLLRSLHLDPQATLPLQTQVPQRPGPDTNERRHQRDALPAWQVEDNAGPDNELTLGETIGKGGMGVVRAATQISLDRPVAVKTLRHAGESDVATCELLREARLTGKLEHPNIIPIYALGQDKDGLPLLVMKRVEGQAWQSHLQGPVPERDLPHHVGILMQVCNALHYSHAKGILHRDVKPENVMLGPYGEVYLLDWGIAIQLTDLLNQSAGNGLAGTPAYMAPEMVAGDARALGVHTDVYLLGACLHQLLTGSPPHPGHELYAVLYHAWASVPVTFGADVPQELADLCRAALAQDPGERPASAAVFRDALGNWLQHRGSSEAAADALESLNELQLLWEYAAQLGGVVADRGETHDRIHHLFGQAHFGLQHALRMWPENPRAGQALQALLTGMTRFALGQGDHRLAAQLLGEMPHPPAGLHQELEALAQRLQAADAELRNLKSLAHEFDMSAGQDVRAAFAWMMTLVWAFAPALAYAGERMGWLQIGYGQFIGAAVLFAVLSGVCVWMYRDELLQNRVNRMVVRIILVTAIIMLGHRLVAWGLHQPVHEALTNDLFLFAFSLGSLASSVDKRIAWGAAVYFGAALVAPWIERDIYALTSIANLVALGSVALAWSPRKICLLERQDLLRRLQQSRCEIAMLAQHPQDVGAQVARVVGAWREQVRENT